MELQGMLIEKAKNSSNWLHEMWINDYYLADRFPVVIHSNPAIILPRQKFRHPEMYIGFAAKVIQATLCYKNLVDNNELPVDMSGGQLLDMSQNLNMFGSCRVPEANRDILYTMDPCKPPNHIIVVHNNHFFRVPVLNSCGEPISLKQIEAQLQDIVRKYKTFAKPVGILTALRRDKWYSAYDELIRENKELLEQIHSALFMLCIDSRTVQPPQPACDVSINLQTLQAMKLLHGGGPHDSSGNRWFDKTLQFVVGCQGEFGLVLEQTAVDVQPVMNLLNFVMDVVKERKHCYDLDPPEVLTYPQPVPLNFKLNNHLEDAIKNAEGTIKKLVDDVDVLFFTFTGFGKNSIKSHCISPDAFIQMAIQLAFYRIHFDTVPTHELVSTRRFCRGRTETIRTPTLESSCFVRTMTDEEKTDGERVETLRTAITVHTLNMREAICGQGADRHLFGLKTLAQKNGMKIPELFVNDAFLQSSNWRLFTGQVKSSYNGGLCLGPASFNGYGVGYNPRDCNINFGLTAFKSSYCTDLRLFHNALVKSLTDMCELLVKCKL